MRRRIFATVLLSVTIAGILPTVATSATFTVTNTNDSGPGSLRQAILDSNQTPGKDTIGFLIPGTGVKTISPTAALPTITDAIVIDGRSQPGYAGVPAIEVSGASAGPGVDGLVVTAGHSEIYAVAINRFEASFSGGGNGIVLATGGENLVVNCMVGTDPAGALALGNQANGILITSSSSNQVIGDVLSGNAENGVLITSGAAQNWISGNRIGVRKNGNTALGNLLDGIQISGSHENWIGPGNVISGNRGNGIRIHGAGTWGNRLFGNRIGVDAWGTLKVPNANNGIQLSDGATNNLIGGPNPPDDSNVISANGGNGIRVSDPATRTNLIGRNLIGTTLDGYGPMGNQGHGILIENESSHNSIGYANTIRFNSGAGIFIASGLYNDLLSNSISSNGALGIDLAPTGVTPNDHGDSDGGPNNLQNFPVLSSTIAAGGTIQISGFLDSMPTTRYRLEFFSNRACDASGYGQGETFLGASYVWTDASGLAIIDESLSIPAPGPWITATASDSAGNTSEFSACVMLPAPELSSITPTSGSPAKGTMVMLTGAGFETGASVTIGGAAAGNSAVEDGMHATAESPPLSPGALYDVVLTNLDGLSATLSRAWLADFLDVPQAHPFHNFVEKLLRHAVTAGCTAGNFCPGDPVTRAQVAVFLLRSHDGPTYVPPPATGMVFADVPAGSFAAAWIEQLAARSITAGCGAGNFCPQSPVTREQMAVFILRTEHGASYVPPDPTGIFADVPVSSPFARWVERLAAEGITSGCGGGNFCPENATTRGQMAVFLVTAFGLM